MTPPQFFYLHVAVMYICRLILSVYFSCMFVTSQTKLQYYYDIWCPVFIHLGLLLPTVFVLALFIEQLQQHCTMLGGFQSFVCC